METLKEIADSIRCIDCECDVGLIAQKISDLDASLCNIKQLDKKQRKLMQLNLSMILNDLTENNEYVRNG